MFKRLLTTSVLATVLVTTPALAWTQRYTVVNNTHDDYFYIAAVTVAEGAGSETATLHPFVGPQQTGHFSLGELSTCTVSVTISQEYGPQIRAPNLFNACNQSTITVTILPNGQWSFTYN